MTLMKEILQKSPSYHFPSRSEFQALKTNVQNCLLGWSLMMEAVRTPETSVDNHFTRQYIPKTILNIILAAVRTCNLTLKTNVFGAISLHTALPRSTNCICEHPKDTLLAVLTKQEDVPCNSPVQTLHLLRWSRNAVLLWTPKFTSYVDALDPKLV
jgi:hypothetical protein